MSNVGNRVFILAIDGLEYDLVIKWKLKNLMQKKYGKIELADEYKQGVGTIFSKEKVFIPYTPKVWASFITGKTPIEHNISFVWTYGRILDFIRHLPLISWIKNKRKFFQKVGLKRRLVSRHDLGYETIFDRVSPSVAVNVPMYNWSTEDYRRIVEAFREEIRKGEEVLWETYEQNKEAILNTAQEKDWRLFMAYTQIADWFGHIHFVKRPWKLHFVYKQLDKLASNLKSLLPKDVVFLIVSDHGMQDSGDGVTGNHSDHAFWSLNIETDWEPKDMTDFYPKILEWARNA